MGILSSAFALRSRWSLQRKQNEYGKAIASTDNTVMVVSEQIPTTSQDEIISVYPTTCEHGGDSVCSVRKDHARLDQLQPELLLDILSYLTIPDVFQLKVAGSRYITSVITSRPRPSKDDYMRFLDSVVPHRTEFAGSYGHLAVAIDILDDTETHWKEQLHEKGHQLLVAAAAQGNDGIIKLVLQKARIIKSTGNTIPGMEALWLAVDGGHESTVSLLLKDASRVLELSRDLKVALHKAILGGDRNLGIVQLLLKNGAKVAGKSWVDFNALHVAAAGGHQAIFKLLLKGGAHISALDSVKGTPLDWAADFGDVVLVEMLLKYSARGTWGLHSAVTNQNLAVVRLLLDNHADIHWRCKPGGNAVLHRAIGVKYEDQAQIRRRETARKHMEMAVPMRQINASDSDSEVDKCDDCVALVRLLLEKGARVNEPGDHGRMPLHLAAASGNEAVVKLLVERWAMPNARDFNQRVPLHDAMERKKKKKDDERDKADYAIALLLIEHGASVDLMDRGQVTALHYAARRGFEAAVKLLLDNGADITLRGGTFSMTALDFAASGGSQSVLQLLLDNGAEGIDDALFYAAFYGFDGYEGAVQLLLDTGADVNVTGKGNGDLGQYSQLTVLEMAIKHGIEWLVRLLLEKGADPRRGRPMYYAIESGNVTIVQLLLESGADVNAVELTQQRVPHQLYCHGKPVLTMSTGLEYTALEMAADHGHELIVQLLVEKGADVHKGHPLYYAVESGKEEIVRLLLEHGAEINAVTMLDRIVVEHVREVGFMKETFKNVGGKLTVLEIAASKGHKLVVRLLLNEGADASIGRPLHYALEHQNKRVGRWLRLSGALELH